MTATIFILERLIRPDKGYALVQDSVVEGCSALFERPSIEKPTTISISDGGEYLVFVELKVGAECSDQRIVIVQRNRKRDYRALPSSSLSNSDARITNVAVTDAGTIFATQTIRFSGAYLGFLRRTYILGSTSARSVRLDNTHLSLPPKNVSVGAVVNDELFYLNGDYDNALPSVSRYVNVEGHSHYDEPIALRHTRSGFSLIGAGHITVACATEAAGYSDSYEHSPKFPIRAMKYEGPTTVSLGQGAGFADDCTGTIGGDDRDAFAAVGQPTIWRNGRKRVLSKFSGSVLALRHRVATGTVDGNAFVTDVSGNGACLHIIPRVRLSGSSWSSLVGFSLTTDKHVFSIAKNDSGQFGIIEFGIGPLSQDRCA